MVHVLVVEDDAATRLLFAAVMQRCKLECTTVADGRAAIEALSRDSYDAVLLDLVLPHTSGFDVLQTIRRTQPDLVGAVVVCSALPHRDLAAEPALNGVAAVFQKPPDIEALASAVVTAAVGIRV